MSFTNISSEDLPNVIYLSLLLVFLASSIIFKSHLKASQLLKQAFGWSIIILIILIGYSFRHDFNSLKNRVSGELFPSKIVKISDQQIAISMSNDGHFYIDLLLNNESVHFMVDTGASDIALNLADAKRVGIDVNHLSAFKKYQTANGAVMSGLAQVDEIEVAGIKFRNVTVSVNNTNMGVSLLGMSFLSQFKKYEFAGDKLILTY
jgi:aspartyl protease family protein